MLRTLLVLPDGTEVFSGPGEQNAVQNITITECVNDTQELSPGSVCANMIELKLITLSGGLLISAGQELEVYRVSDDGTRYKVGIFTTEMPTRPSANSMSITAYDRVSWLDKDLTQWLLGLTDWPYSLGKLAWMVCAECGLELASTEIPNGEYQVQQFSAEGITGRQLMRWIGQVAGRFCRATTDGTIEFAWYTPFDDGSIGVGSESTLYYFRNSLSYEDYVVAPILKVQLRQNEEDVGTVWPTDIAEEVNTYAVTGNYLLTASTAEELVPVAQTLYEQLKDISYTPCKVSVPATPTLHAGNTIEITDRNGRVMMAYIMTKKQSGQTDTLECTGTARRDSSSATNNQRYEALKGKVLNLRRDVDGIKAENKDTSGRMAKIELDIDGIQTMVTRQEKDVEGVKNSITGIMQTADEISATVQSIQENGASKVTTEFGLTIDKTAVSIHRSGSNMTNKLNEQGMYVVRNEATDNETAILQADAKGVIATDVSVRNYLIIGNHARFEDYNNGTDSKRTACFWLGG